MFETGPGVSEVESYGKVDDADDTKDAHDRRRTTVYPLSSPGAFGSGEPKIGLGYLLGFQVF